MKTKTKLLMAIVTILPFGPAVAFAQNGPSFAGIFTDNMVLQRNKPIKIWGKADPASHVNLKFNAQDFQTSTNADGDWSVLIPPKPANSNGITISVSSNSKSVKIENVLMGDVFLCSGQSNMEFTTKYETNAEQNIIKGADELLRFYNVPKQTADYEQKEFSKLSNWEIAEQKTIGNTSALCFSMAQEFRKQQAVPIGFINSSWGGTKIETWMSEETLAMRPRYRAQIEHSNAIKKDPKGAITQWASANLKYWEQNEPSIAVKSQWRMPEFDDSSWKDIKLGTFWESAGIKELEQFDGLIWYRTKFTLTPEQAGSDAILNLGPIDDADNVFINGAFIGAAEGWDSKREYIVPKSAFKPGENTLAIRIYDGGGGGGLWGNISDNNFKFSNGTNITLNSIWKYKISANVSQIGIPPSSATSPASRPSTIYNAMIAPLRGLSIAGVAWYQGESNVGLAGEYADASALWMANWRKDFNNPNLAFGIVQLSAYGKSVSVPVNSSWAKLRDAQLQAIKNDKNSAIAASLDIGDKYDIHPTQKQVLGLRLAKALGALVYNNGASRTGPIATSAKRQGNNIIVEFANLSGALLSYSAKFPPGIELCDQNHCEFALAQTRANSLVINVPRNMRPIKVRYAWSDSPVVSLYSSDDLPIPTFEMEISQ